MDTYRRPADEFLDVARALLLVQGAILIATTIEAVVWAAAFHAGGSPVLMSGTAAAVLLVARVRLRADRQWARRLVYGVEGLLVLTLVIDTALAIVLGGAVPPVAVVTQLALPVSVIALLRQEVTS